MTSGKKLLLVVVVLAVVVIAVIALMPRGPVAEIAGTGPVVVEEPVPTDPEEKAAFDRRKAASACRVAILQSLKDPATAEFVEELHSTPWVVADGGDYNFTIGVRARSEAGAMVTRPFTCRAHAEPNGWSIASLAEGSAP